jgi:hypothetical protein
MREQVELLENHSDILSYGVDASALPKEFTSVHDYAPDLIFFQSIDAPYQC